MTQDNNLSPLGVTQLVLETERLVLQPLSMDDTGLAISMFTDPDVVRYVCDLYSPEEIAENLHTQIRRGAGGRIGIWSMTRKDSGEKIGSCILLPVPVEEDDTDWSLVVEDRYPEAEIEVGYLLRPQAWGQGFATEICQRLLRFSFEMTSLSEIVATTDQKNTASHHVLGKCGLTNEGLQRAYATECTFFRIRRDDWERDNP